MSVRYEEIHWQPMPEANDREVTLHQLVRLLQHDIPAFIIRCSEHIDGDRAEQLHDQNVKQLRSMLKLLHPRIRIRRGLDERSDGFDDHGVGVFHTDVADVTSSLRNDLVINPSEVRTGVALHTDIFGLGVVVAAKPGPSSVQLGSRDGDVARYGSISAMREQANHPNALLKRGLVDPRLTDPICHIALTKPGDTVVQAEGGKHSAWHRYDTPLPEDARSFRLTSLHASKLLFGKHVGFDFTAEQ